MYVRTESIQGQPYLTERDEEGLVLRAVKIEMVTGWQPGAFADREFQAWADTTLDEAGDVAAETADTINRWEEASRSLKG